MSARWTPDEDAFLLHWEGVGADYVASHDLSRPDGAGSRRLKHLYSTGARKHWLVSEIARLRFERAAGHVRGAMAHEALSDSLRHLQAELAQEDPLLAEAMKDEARQ